MEMIEAGKKILLALERAGFEAYFVGGFVRDRLLGRPVMDVDVCTNARPGEVMKLFARTVPTGLKHGTVTVIIDACPVEVTTYRREGDYKDYRRPREVEFVDDLLLDLARRDFTINAMAMDKDGNVIDPFGGRNDLRRSLIRAVGDPEERFREDALRMLRAFRFAAQLGFHLERGTWRALRARIGLLSRIARERIRDELRKLLASPFPDHGLRYLLEAGTFSGIPELSALFSPLLLQKPLPLLRKLDGEELRWNLLFAFAEFSLERVRSLLKSLRFSNSEIAGISELYRAYSELRASPSAFAATDWRPYVLEYGAERLARALELIALPAGWQPGELQALKRKIVATERELPVKAIGDLAVNGHDLAAATGKKPGPWIGAALENLFSRVVYGGLPNEKEALLREAKMLAMRGEREDENEEKNSPGRENG
ncbi:CCA tRNA nucleotidyltransferase [Bacillaceae bacterium]